MRQAPHPRPAADLAAGNAAEAAARTSYGRLIASLTVRTRNIAAAEDALADALAAALRVWPKTGVPDRPEAWLLTAARRVAGHASRHRAVADQARGTIEMMYDEMHDRPERGFPDERLKLLFTCAHPAIDASIRTPLMLQTVLGLDAATIGAAFVVPGPTMAQRLVRAKLKIRHAGIPFATPEPADLPDRLGDVLAAVYAAYGTAWDMIGGDDGDGNGDDDGGRGGGGGDLVAEAVFLGRLVMTLLPAEPEPKGLLALMLYCEARRPARRGTDGGYVPLQEQDRDLWSSDLIIEAEGFLRRAATAGRFGRFQAEAAIQSLHVQTPRGRAPDAQALVLLYDVLAGHHPTLGVLVSRAVAHGALRGAQAGLALLDALPAERVARYQPFWAARLHLARGAGDAPGAAAARDRALALTRDPAVSRWLSSA